MMFLLGLFCPLVPLDAGEFTGLCSVTDADGEEVPISYVNVSFPDPNNDNVVVSSNSLDLGEIEFTKPGPIDFLVKVGNTGGTTEYRLDFGLAKNSTGQTWSGFRAIGGLGLGDDFVRISELDNGILPAGIDWDTPHKDSPPTSPDFDLLQHEDDLLAFGNGTVASGETALGQSISGDIPDTSDGTSYMFTIRLLPVVDEPPVIDSCAIETSQLWPPNHKLVDVGLAVAAADDVNPFLVFDVLVYSDEDDESQTGDGHHSPDAVFGDGVLQLRAERRGDRDGRVYLIVVITTDSAGNESFACCTVVVPHGKNKNATRDVDDQADFAATFCEILGEAPPGFVLIGDGEILGPKN